MKTNQEPVGTRQRSANLSKQKEFRQASGVSSPRERSDSLSSADLVAQLGLAFEVAIKQTLQRNFNPIPSVAEIRRALLLLPQRILPPKQRGRPRDPRVTEATELHRLGKPWPYIYPRTIGGFDSLKHDERILAMLRLRQAVRARRALKTEHLDFFHEEIDLKFSE
jgi:hypothetical protein